MILWINRGSVSLSLVTNVSAVTTHTCNLTSGMTQQSQMQQTSATLTPYLAPIERYLSHYKDESQHLLSHFCQNHHDDAANTPDP